MRANITFHNCLHVSHICLKHVRIVVDILENLTGYRCQRCNSSKVVNGLQAVNQIITPPPECPHNVSVLTLLLKHMDRSVYSLKYYRTVLKRITHSLFMSYVLFMSHFIFMCLCINKKSEKVFVDLYPLVFCVHIFPASIHCQNNCRQTCAFKCAISYIFLAFYFGAHL